MIHIIKFLFYFSANGKIIAEVSSRNKNKVRFHHSGLALWTEPAEFHTLCDVNPQAFPFDVQNCSLRIIGWMTGAQYVTYTGDSIVLTEFHKSTEWTLLDFKTKSFESDQDDYTTSNVVFEFIFKRRSGYYVLTVIIPFTVVSVLGLMTFPLPPDSGEKVSLGMTCLLSFFVIQSAVSDQLPTSSYTMPFIGRFSIPYDFFRSCEENTVIHQGLRRAMISSWLYQSRAGA